MRRSLIWYRITPVQFTSLNVCSFICIVKIANLVCMPEVFKERLSQTRRSIAVWSNHRYSDTSNCWYCCQSIRHSRFSHPCHSHCHPDRSTDGSRQSAASDRDRSWSASDKWDTQPPGDCEWVAYAGGDSTHLSRRAHTSDTILASSSLPCSWRCFCSSTLALCRRSLDLRCPSPSPIARPLQYSSCKWFSWLSIG